MQERLGKPLSLEDLTKALDSFKKNKTPGSDGLPAKFYLALWDLIGQVLLEVYDSTLLAGSMREPMRKEKFAKETTSDHKSMRKWSAGSILETLREKERVDPVTWFPEQITKVIWQNASSPKLSNKHQVITSLV
eukprot:g28021.t1